MMSGVRGIQKEQLDVVPLAKEKEMVHPRYEARDEPNRVIEHGTSSFHPTSIGQRW
tara:strand:+ start:106 stop:273 length:168 start_codon:yes stop_codon:yes gene_type:complete